MNKQKFYGFLRKQILLMIGLSFIPGLGYIGLGWMNNIIIPALILYTLVILVSLWGWKIYKDFEFDEMGKEDLENWYRKLTYFLYNLRLVDPCLSYIFRRSRE